MSTAATTAGDPLPTGRNPPATAAWGARHLRFRKGKAELLPLRSKDRRRATDFWPNWKKSAGEQLQHISAPFFLRWKDKIVERRKGDNFIRQASISISDGFSGPLCEEMLSGRTFV